MPRCCSIALVGILACSPSGGSPSADGGGSSEGTGDTALPEDTSASEASDSGASSGGATTATNGSSTVADDTTGSQTEDTSDSSDTGEDPPSVGCPDRLPRDWILCEDFESVTDPGAEFGTWSNIDGALAIEDGPARSGRRSYRVEHRPEADWGGWLDLRFGEGPPGGTVHRPGETFDEVWVRFWVRRDRTWTSGGFGDLVEVQALAADTGAIAADGTVLGPTGAAAARLIAWSCIHDGALLCDGDDWVDADLRALDYEDGSAPIFGADTAAAWQCVEVHMRLDAPDRPGELDIAVDGAPDQALAGLPWLGTWSDVGINNVRLSSWWPDVPMTMLRHIDDVVVATSPIGCE